MTSYITPEGKAYNCIGYAVDIRSGWEWYAFDDMGDGTYFGYVMGFENEFGYFSADELKENGIAFTTSKAAIDEIAPPTGWKRNSRIAGGAL